MDLPDHASTSCARADRALTSQAIDLLRSGSLGGRILTWAQAAAMEHRRWTDPEAAAADSSIAGIIGPVRHQPEPAA